MKIKNEKEIFDLYVDDEDGVKIKKRAISVKGIKE